MAVPDKLRSGPFTRAVAVKAGVTSRMLQGPNFERVYPRVWRLADHEMTDADWRLAAQLALPKRARLTGISRIQALGLDYGPRLPVRFVVEGDLHLAFENVFLHRTKKLPPVDDVGVTPEAAFIAYCACARVIDAIKVGDWLIHHGHMTVESLQALAVGQLWRNGADEACWILEHLDGDSRSLKESETRAVLTFAGLPKPELNVPVDLGGEGQADGDLVYRRWKVVVEYEGTQHREDPEQFESDIDRYALFRRHGQRYVQVTNDRLAQPRRVVIKVYGELVAHGYDGPAPDFGEKWRLLFKSVRLAVGPRDYARRSA